MDITNVIENTSDNVLKELVKELLWKDCKFLNLQIYNKPLKMSRTEYCNIIYNELRKRNINPWQK